MTFTFVNYKRLSDLSSSERQALLQRSHVDLAPYIEKVRPILSAIKQEGDEALVRFVNEFDKSTITLNSIAASQSEFEEARQLLAPEICEALIFAANNIQKFHEAQRRQKIWWHEVEPGLMAGERTVPIESAACYVPRGKGSFPSSALMSALPAQIAGVARIVILTPPGPDGKIDPATLFAAQLAGVSEVYKAGGAQAVAAATYGTQTITPCIKIVGPGSLWFMAAKQLVADIIDTGIAAGPSESIIFADDTVNGELAALDLLIEAEHGSDSSAFLVTTSEKVARQALAALPHLWEDMSVERATYVRNVLTSSRGGILVTENIAQAFAFINDYAPEHLQILSQSPLDYLNYVRNAGEILFGPYTPSTLGNFILGPSHILPTGGSAKISSPLSVHDFQKRQSLGLVSKEAYERFANQARTIAIYEGFEAHANAVSDIRAQFISKERR